MVFGDGFDIVRLEAGSVRQRVDPDDRRFEPISPTKIERCPRRRSHRHRLRNADFVIAELLAVDDDPAHVAGLATD
jgi:hypothetical protein